MIYFIKTFIIVILSYLVGSILSGEIIARLKNVDLRKQGSGNVGATNVLRSIGSFYGALVLLGDALKGIVAVLLGGLLGSYHGFDMAILTGVTAIIGHNWPIFSKFRGGKGIATSLGVIIALTPLSLIIALPVFVILLLLFGYVSLASISAAILYPVSVSLFYPHDPYKLTFAICIAVLAVYRHQTNLKRLFKGEEHRILHQQKPEKDKGDSRE